MIKTKFAEWVLFVLLLVVVNMLVRSQIVDDALYMACNPSGFLENLWRLVLCVFAVSGFFSFVNVVASDEKRGEKSESDKN